jgi:outer membrane receptor for ferric coprogen and ferric-rhodotorulic acid
MIIIMLELRLPFISNHLNLKRREKMKLSKLPIVLAIATVHGSIPALAFGQDDSGDPDTLPEVNIRAAASADAPSEQTESYTIRSSASATRLDTSLRETPQSMSVVTRQLIEDFKLNSVNDALDFATGIRVERAETDRTYYTARGSDVTNFQVDGIGAPMTYGLTYGDLDTALYDRIEVIRGANGLLSGTGNPSATVNFIRKRPTRDFQARIDLSAGSWNNRRVQTDVSGALNEAGNVRGRLVLVNQDKDPYLDRYSLERNVAYGIIEADITEQTRLTFGHTYHQNDSNGVLWGALPLLDENGNRRHFDVSDSSAANWSRWDTTNNITFGELNHLFDNGWDATLQVSRKELTAKSELFYVMQFNAPVGMLPFSGYYRDSHKELTADAHLSGPFSLAGREHEAVFGTTWSRQTIDEKEKSGNIAPFLDFDAIPSIPQPVYGAGMSAALDIKRLNSYAAVKWNVTDDLKLTTGANLLTYKLTGDSYGAQQEADAHDKITPYVGAVYALNDIHSVYGSYTAIYNPQVQLDRDLKPIAPIEGKNYEVGLKSEFFDKRLNTSVALFRNEQQNVAQQAGFVGGLTIYEGFDAITKGYEIDISGELTPNLSVNGGFTNLMSVKDEDDNNVKPYVPRRVFRLATVYKVPQIEKLKVGANLNWQSSMHTTASVTDIATFATAFSQRIKQDDYLIVNLMANYEIDKNWSAALNLYNVTDQKYFTSLMWDQSYYAPPRSAMATLSWKY